MIVLAPYEMPLAVRGSLDEAHAKQALENVKKIITDSKGEVGEIEEWGKKPLQFEVSKETSASYFLVNFEADQKTIPGLGTKLRMNEELLRFLIIRKLKPKKLKEKIKASLAKSESKRASLASGQAKVAKKED